jgi:hypothetical protein
MAKTDTAARRNAKVALAKCPSMLCRIECPMRHLSMTALPSRERDQVGGLQKQVENELDSE